MDVVLPFPLSVGPLPLTQAEGKHPLRKDIQEALFPQAGKQRQPTALRLQACIWKEPFRFYNGRPPDLVTTEIPELGPSISLALCEPCKDIPSLGQEGQR